MANDNNINIGTISTGNTINITQQQAPSAAHIEYSVADGSVQHLTRAEVNKGALTFWASASLPVLAIAADSLGVLSFFGVQTLWGLAVVIPIAIVGAALSNGKKKISARSFKKNEALFIDGQWVEENDEGDYVLYRKVAPCIYPKCSGSVAIVPAPPREQGNHTLVGVCSVGGHRHTYSIDYNDIGYPAQFDWRPLEKREP